MTNRMTQEKEVITAPVSLTKEEWGLLIMFIHNAAPMLPKGSWDTASNIEHRINAALENPIREDTQIMIGSMRHSLKTQKNDIANLKSQIKKLKSNYRFNSTQFNCLG